MGNLKTSAILLMTAALCPGATWNQANSGLPGVSLGVNALTIDPASPSTIYARSTGIPNGSLSQTLGLFKSTDAGANWTDISNGLSVTALVIDPKNSSTLYAGTFQGIAKSTNGGASWTDASTGLSDGSVTSLSIDPLNPSILYAVIANSSTAFPPVVSSPVAVIFKSTNGGASWSKLNAGIPPGGFVNLLLVDPGTPTTLYIFVPSFGAPANAGGPSMGSIFKSTDGGDNWRMLNTDLPPGITILSLTIDHASPSTLYAQVPFIGVGFPTATIFKSTDGGNTWQMIHSDLASGSTLGSLVIDPAAPSTFYATGQTFGSAGPPAYRIFKSTDAGQHWSVFNTGLPANNTISSLVLDPASPSRLYAGFTALSGPPFGPPSNTIGVSGGGIVKSTDAGQTWNATGGSLTGFDIRTLAANPLDANTLYTGGLGGVFKTIDGGANWNATGVSGYTSSVLTDSGNPNLLYAQTGSTNGCNSDARLLLSSTDSGANWSDTVSPSNSGCILNATFPSVHAAPMATAPNTLYLAEADDLDGYSALLKSTDGGSAWSVAWDWFTGLRGNVRAIAIDLAHPLTVYAGIDDAKGSNSGLFKSTDGGTTWTDTQLTKSAVNLLLVDPSNANIVYAATEGPGFQHLFKSTDGGATWVAIEMGLKSVLGNRLITSTGLIVDPSNPTALFLGTSSSGVFRSVDSGANWSAFNDGLTSLVVRALVIAPGPSRTVYAGTSSGVFKIIDQ